MAISVFNAASVLWFLTFHSGDSWSHFQHRMKKMIKGKLKIELMKSMLIFKVIFDWRQITIFSVFIHFCNMKYLKGPKNGSLADIMLFQYISNIFQQTFQNLKIIHKSMSINLNWWSKIFELLLTTFIKSSISRGNWGSISKNSLTQKQNHHNQAKLNLS